MFIYPAHLETRILQMTRDSLRPLKWIGRSKKDYLEFPPLVQDRLGYALFRVQEGVPELLNAKPLSGGLLHGLGIVELSEDYDTDTYRAVYLARFAEVVYVLHAFKKKSLRGTATPRHDIELIRSRYEAAIQDYRRNYGGKR